MQGVAHDPETMRLTGTHTSFTEPQIRTWLAGLPGRDDRVDWAVMRIEDERQLGEVVLNDLDPDNATMGFRISLDTHAVGQRYGTEADRAVVEGRRRDALTWDCAWMDAISMGLLATDDR